MLSFFTFQNIFYQGHRHQYSSNTRICIYMVGENIHQLWKLIAVLLKLVWLTLKAKSSVMIFKHPYLTHTKSSFRNFWYYEFNTSFLHIYRLDFHLKKKTLPSNFEKILWSNKFLKVPPCRNYFLWKSRWHLLLMRPWALNLDYTTFPFLHFGIL
jgi:hypothetical protein